MNILILAAASGGGHLRAAHALEQYILDNTAGNQVWVVDALKFVNHILDKTCCEGYQFIATKAPKVFGQLYRATNEETPLLDLVTRFNGAFARKLYPLIEDQKPDVILCTHPFATEMISHLKGKGKVTVPLICLMTDYGPHRAWFAEHVDAYVVSTEDMIPQMEEMGVSREIIHPFGIPINDVFFNKRDKNALLESFGLTGGVPTLLFMAGSFGVTNIMALYSDLVKLPMDFQVIVITGRNQKLYDAFQEKILHTPKPTKLIFYTNEVEKYMHAASLIVTKPGGLTVSEALACTVPLAVFDAIPGQEEDNASFLIAHGMAVPINSANCTSTIRTLLENSSRLEQMRSSCAEFDKSDSSRNILELMQTLVDK